MPKSPRSSPSSSTKSGGGERLTDEQRLRKKKNADAQAAFRARRAHYIATLEETVSSLESVVLQLQDSWREARAELTEARLEIQRLQHQYRERDRFWRDLLENRKNLASSEVDELNVSTPSFPSLHNHPNTLGAQLGGHHITYGLDGLAYRSPDDTSGPQPSYGTQQEFSGAPNPLSFNEADISGDGTSHCLAQRIDKVNYSYSMSGSASRAARWTSSMTSLGDSSPSDATQPPSATMAESVLTSPQLTYIPRFPNDDPKLSLGSFEPASFNFNNERFPESRSLSPTSGSSSSASIPSPSYPYGFTDPALSQENFRRSSHSTEMTLHGGTADISLMSSTDGVRYRIGVRQPVVIPERPLLSLGRPTSSGESHHEPGSSDGDSAPYSGSRLRSRKNIALHSSRSPSPVAPTLSCTVAVIKAQAFGALRRTRTRNNKKPTGSPAQTAVNVLEARGIGVNPTLGHKRPKVQDEE